MVETVMANEGPQDAAKDVEFLRELVTRAQRRVDPHAYHLVLWGALVLVWYPVVNWLQDQRRFTEMSVVGGIGLLLGIVGSTVLSSRVAKRTRVEGQDHALADRIGTVVGANVGVGVVLSVLAPATRFVDGEAVPILWGLVYASIAFHIGMLYSKEFVWSGIGMFLGACAAMFVPHAAGYVLGPVMGIGMIVPGLVAERRVRRLGREAAEHAVGSA
jgi:hypothetical protein